MRFIREARHFFRKSPLLSLSGIIILGLGIGASSFSLALLSAFSSIVYPGMKPQGYATLSEDSGGGSIAISWNRIQKMRRMISYPTIITAYSETVEADLQTHATRRNVNVAAASNIFGILTPPLTAGHDFSQNAIETCSSHEAILGYSLSRSIYRSISDDLGSEVMINDTPFRIVGIAPVGFRGTFWQKDNVWIPPACMFSLISGAPSKYWGMASDFYGIASSSAMSSSQLASFLPKIIKMSIPGESELHVTQGLTITPIHDAKVRRKLRLSLLITLVFTFLCCLNYSLLLLMRMPLHMQEATIKKALGASRRRIAEELVAGPALMALASVLFACAILMIGFAHLPHLLGTYSDIVSGARDAGAIAFFWNIVFCFCVTVIIAALPIIFTWRDDNIPRLSNTTTASANTMFTIQLAVILQMALCACILVVTGMIVNSLRESLHQSLGYDPENLSVVQATMTASGGITLEAGTAFPTVISRQAVMQSLQSIPGVESVSFTSSAPLDGSPRRAIQIAAIMDGNQQRPHTVYWSFASPGFFRTVEAHLILGYYFQKITESKNAQDIIVNRTVAEQIWHNQNPVGKTALLIYPASGGIPTWDERVTIDGVVDDISLSGYEQSHQPWLYFSSYQGHMFDTGPEFIVRGNALLYRLIAEAKPVVRSLMPGLGVDGGYVVSQRLHASLIPEIHRVELSTAGSFLMVLISCIGLYGSLSFYVANMRRSLALRICFGASRAHLRNIVFRRTATCSVLGVLLSLPLWVLLIKFPSNLAIGKFSWSASMATIIVLVYAGVAFLVALSPAATATRVSPSEVLKEQ